MRAVLQRVSRAKVETDNEIVGKIKKGIVILLGIARNDTKKDADWLLNKIINLRIFSDKDDKMNKSLKDIRGELLVISQFTLLGNCKKGRRPSFDKAASPDSAETLYNYFLKEAKKTELNVSSGKFKELMQVELINDGPVTFILDTE